MKKRFYAYDGKSIPAIIAVYIFKGKAKDDEILSSFKYSLGLIYPDCEILTEEEFLSAHSETFFDMI